MTPEAFAQHCLEIRLRGYTILSDLFSATECEEAGVRLAEICGREATAPGAPSAPHGPWAYNLMNKERVFEGVYGKQDLLRLIRHFLGDDAVLQGVMGRIVLPGAPAQRLHYDGSLTGPFRATSADDTDRRDVEIVYGLNVIWPLTDFTAENGATRLVPGSHRLPDRVVPAEGPAPGEVVVIAPRGSALVFNIALWHGASAHTGSEPRLALITPWRRSWVRPEVDLSRMVLPEVLKRAGPEGRTIFGFRSRPPYTERWQWDAAEGRPKPEWRHLERDEPLPAE